MGDLSERQQAILDFISRHCARNGYPPTVREIGLAVGLASPSTVHAHLAKLEEAGYIRRDPTKPRAMLLNDRRPAPEEPVRRAAALPLVGAVAAGSPILADEQVEDWVEAPFAGDFILRVRGDSMVEDGILDGDMVVVRKQDTARDGEIVVARIEDEATVKRIYRDGRRIRLQPANSAYEPIMVDEAHVLGRVVGVMRAL
ncbi:MAG: transcriptional repressor LexA [Actinomycetota bacterium]